MGEKGRLNREIFYKVLWGRVIMKISVRHAEVASCPEEQVV